MWILSRVRSALLWTGIAPCLPHPLSSGASPKQNPQPSSQTCSSGPWGPGDLGTWGLHAGQVPARSWAGNTSLFLLDPPPPAAMVSRPSSPQSIHFCPSPQTSSSHPSLSTSVGDPPAILHIAPTVRFSKFPSFHAILFNPPLCSVCPLFQGQSTDCISAPPRSPRARFHLLHPQRAPPCPPSLPSRGQCVPIACEGFALATTSACNAFPP